MKQKDLVKTIIFRTVLVITLAVSFFVITASVHAGTSVPALENPAEGKLVTIDFENLTTRIIEWALYAAGAVAVVFLIIGGFQYISSRGNEEQMEHAKKTITAAIIGIVIIVMAFAIVSIVNNILTSDAPA